MYLQHLCRTNDGFPGHVALGDDHLLGQEDLTCWNLNAQITSRHHHAVRLRQDLVKVLQTLFVLNLDNDLDVGPLWPEALPDINHVLSTTDEGSEYHIDAVLHTKLEISLVFFRESGKIDSGLGEINTLAGAKGPIVDGADLDIWPFDGKNKKGQDSIVDID